MTRKGGKSKFGGEGQEHPRARTKRAQLRFHVIAVARKLVAGDADAQAQLQLALTELDNHEKKHGEW